MAFECADQHRIKRRGLIIASGLRFVAPVLAQAQPLFAATGAELVVVVGTKRGLAMAHKKEMSHAPILARIGALASRQRAMARCLQRHLQRLNHNSNITTAPAR